MQTLFLTILLSLQGLGTQTAIATTTPEIIVEELTVEEKIRHKAVEYGVNPDHALAVANCESGLVPQQSNLHNSFTGQRERSYGIWQINTRYNPEVTIEQAMDIDWSTDWAMERLKDGKWHLWSCSKIVGMI